MTRKAAHRRPRCVPRCLPVREVEGRKIVYRCALCGRRMEPEGGA